ncbi:HlyD family type I secretion periplasmic adaptor subunit [Verminephrobacter aporrectodeae]|uniref:HlyD family type I secretion periplasmic adaptor subunit n=1 Tax=Verminephrobacter aporrectodeae TaxID=1110389 RepID=UPI0022445B6A|nr:HlyD family type I secretion periplasmic adaptor subunit [Verminephrobacter aporrectodeae]MCW8176778.1 HlyD family type I secretion periplasmic adaptor subunit [Verminephrobacter aporrectodeae subsp. tuberculatae]MCW8204379.1 HlyD family type I secretion periplasmic adaptor subunit [Verminephrobacter aporrectodeae subsp. tuberculatae]
MSTVPRHPALELLARYRAVLRTAWARRAELAGPARLADEQAFLPAALSLQEMPVHPAPRRIAYALMALFLSAVAWTTFGKIDIVAVAPGRIIVSERTKTVQPLERSVVRRILVQDGDRVQAGQPLMELDPTDAQADRASLLETHKAAQSEWLRTRVQQQMLRAGKHKAPVDRALDAALRENAAAADWTEAERARAQAQLAAEWNDVSARLDRLSAEQQRREAERATVQAMIDKLESTVPIARQREQDFQTLMAQGFMSVHARQDRTRERIELERDLATQKARLYEAQAALREAEKTRNAYLAETLRALSERQAQADLKRHQTGQELTKARQREQRATLTAPVSGTVQQLALHTEGGVVTEAQALMVIVPESASMSAEVTLENKDIGFVAPGQNVSIKLETFPFTRYGTVPAQVEKVTQDAVNDEKRGAIFPATLKLGRTHIDVDGKPIRLAPGMNITAEIKTGQRRVIEYLLSPIQRAGSESLRER